MQRKNIVTSIMVSVFLIGNAVSVMAQGTAPADVLKVIQEHVKGLSIKSGTLDMYDEKASKVRNLRTMAFPETVTEKDGAYVATIKYRDVRSGDIVNVDAVVDSKATPLAVKELKIVGVEKLKDEKKEGAPAKEYTDAEVQTFMKTALDQQAKFTGSLMLFDEERNKMRTLQMVSLDSAVKRLGIFYSSRAELKDMESGDLVVVEVSTENKDGELNLQALRIREVKRQPKPVSTTDAK